MATTTTTIPQTSLPVGATVLGSTTVAVFSQAALSVDRAGPAGPPWLDTLTPASTLTVGLQYSPDGASWFPMCQAATGGGPQTDRHGQPVTAWSLGFSSTGVPGDRVRAVATVAGPSPIEVSGTVTTGP
jgi:hypothetical protein